MKIKMSDNNMTITLQAPVFSGKVQEWTEFIVRLQAFLAMKGCTEAIDISLNPNCPIRRMKSWMFIPKLGKQY